MFGHCILTMVFRFFPCDIFCVNPSHLYYRFIYTRLNSNSSSSCSSRKKNTTIKPYSSVCRRPPHRTCLLRVWTSGTSWRLGPRGPTSRAAYGWSCGCRRARTTGNRLARRTISTTGPTCAGTSGCWPYSPTTRCRWRKPWVSPNGGGWPVTCCLNVWNALKWWGGVRSIARPPGWPTYGKRRRRIQKG